MKGQVWFVCCGRERSVCDVVTSFECMLFFSISLWKCCRDRRARVLFA